MAGNFPCLLLGIGEFLICFFFFVCDIVSPISCLFRSYGHPVYGVLYMHLTERIGKGDRLEVRADLIKCLCLLGLYKIKKSMVRGHTI